MSTRYDELTKILGTGSAGTPSPTPAAEEQKQTSRRDELYSLLGASEPEAPATAATGASTTQSSPVSEKPKQETLQQTTPQSASLTAPLTQGSLAGDRSAEQVQQGERTAPAETAQITQSQAQAELDRLKPVLEEAKQYENEMGRYVSGAGQDESLYLRAQTRRDSLLKKYGYSSVDELNKAVMDYTFASGNELSFMQKMDRAGYAMGESLKNTVLSGDWWKKVLSGSAEQWYGSQLNAAGTVAGNIESPGRESTGIVYENELRARNDWATTLEEAKAGVIKMDAEGIKEIENIIAYYDDQLLPSLRSGVQAYETLAEDSAQAADEITAKGQQNTEKAKEGLGWGGQLAVDLLTQGTMIALDKATGAPNISMFTRGLGSGAQEARQDGASAQKQIGYGAAVGTVEVLTNKLFDGLAGIYGKGAADKVVEDTIAKLAKSRAGQASLRLLASGFNEGMEEILSDAINPLLRTIYSGKSVKEEYSGEQLSQWLYDGLVGAIMGTGLTAVNPETYAFNAGDTQTGAAQANPAPQPPAEQKNTARSQAESTTVNTDPAQHTAAEQAVIDEYQASVDNRLLSFIERWKTLKNPNYKKRIQMPIAEITDRAAEEIRLLIGVDVTDYKHILSGNALEHIEIRHGKNGEADHSLSDPNDIARMGYVLENYDVIEPILDSHGRQKRSKQYSSADNTMAPLISFRKSVNGTYYVVEAVPDSAAKQLRVVSAYMQKKSRSTDQVLNMAKAPQLTPKVPHGADTPAGTPPVNAEALRITSKNAAIMPENSIQQSGRNYNDNLQLAVETGNTGERNGEGSLKGSSFGRSLSEARNLRFRQAELTPEVIERSETEGGNFAAKPTDPAEAAVEQEYRSLVENAITEGDYQRAVALYREYNNPTLRAYKEFYTLKTFSEYAASQSCIPAPDTAVGTEDALAAFEESYRKAIENAAKDGIIAAGTPTDHFDRKARLYGLEEDLAAVNPNFATEKYEWTHNCQRCVSTLEMRFRGFKVTAKPIPVKAEHDDLALTVELAWENAVKKWCLSDNGRAQVEEYMRRWGDGSRAIVGMTFPSGMGHVFFAMQIDGKTVFVDPQYPAADCEQYFKQYVKSWLYVIRVDNLQPSDRITDCCKSGDE